MAGKPLQLPIWSTDGNYPAGANSWNGTPTKVAPTAGKQAEGTEPNERFAAQADNWWKNLTYTWLQWMQWAKATNWRVLTVLNANSLGFVVFNPANGRWCIGGSTGKNFASHTCKEYALQNTDVGAVSWLAAGVDNNGNIVAGGPQTALWETSDEGGTWTSVSAGYLTAVTAAALSTFNTRGISYDAVHGLWILALEVSNPTIEGCIFTTPDLVTFTLRDTRGSTAWNHCATNPAGVSVAVGGVGGIISSTNGTAWTSHNQNALQTFRGVSWDADRALWVVVGDAGVCYTSPDAATWTQQPVTNVGINFRRVACDGGLWVAAITHDFFLAPTVLASVDAGLHWAWIPFDTPAGFTNCDIRDIVHGDNQFVGVTSQGYAIASMRIGRERGWPGGALI